MKSFVEIYEISTGKVDRKFDVTGKGSSYIDKLISGIENRLNDDFNVRIVKEPDEKEE